MDEPLEIRRAAPRVEGRAVERELHDVAALNAVRRARTRQQVVLRIVGMARADMAEGIDHAFTRENAVCSDELFNELIDLGHFSLAAPLRSARNVHASPQAGNSAVVIPGAAGAPAY